MVLKVRVLVLISECRIAGKYAELKVYNIVLTIQSRT